MPSFIIEWWKIAVFVLSVFAFSLRNPNMGKHTWGKIHLINNVVKYNIPMVYIYEVLVHICVVLYNIMLYYRTVIRYTYVTD